MSKLKPTRRDLLKWIGAGAIATPVLLSASGRRLVAAGDAARPRRMVILFTPHGAPAEYFWPQSATNYASSAPGDVSILAPLQRHAAKLNVLRGIDYIGSDNHYANRDVLTNKTSDSIDTVVARSLGVAPLRLGVVPDYANSFTVDGYLAFDGGNPQQHKPDPAAVFDALVGDFPTDGGGGEPPPDPGPTRAQLRTRALAAAEEELGALSERLGPSPAAAGLAPHAAAVAAMRAGGGGGPAVPVAGCETRPTLASVEAVRGRNVFAAENFPALLDAQLDIAELALRCGLTRVVSIQCGYVNHGIPFTWIGQNEGHHQLSHNSPGAPGRIGHALCQSWYAEKLAGFLDRLETPDPEDPEHTILDNTVALWCSEIADGQLHNCQSLPLVLAGGGGGALVTGQYLELGGRGHAELLLAMAAAMNVTGVSFGTGSEGGPLAEVMA